MDHKTKVCSLYLVVRISAFIFLFCISFSGNAQTKNEQALLNSSQTFSQSRFNTVVIGEAIVATAATIGLQYLWYKKFPKSRFHFFNDNNEWLGMDKMGHAATAYNISAIQYNLMRWSGVDNNRAILIGGLTGLGYLTVIEIMDGFSSQWGFSPGDMAANIFGSAAFMSQQYAWNEQRIQIRFSFHRSVYSQYNPSMLGKRFFERLLKDYNGQSYWLSFNISSFINSNNDFPKWLNADIGFGADGMVAARTNPGEINGKKIPSFVRQHKLFFGVDAAWAKKDQTSFPSWFNIVRIPSPVLEWKMKTKQLKPHLLYH